MNVGNIKETCDENGVIGYAGQMRTYSLDLGFKLEIVSSRHSEESPTHIVIGRGAHGKGFQAGVAWLGKAKEGDNMFSMSLTIPELGMEDQKFVAFYAKDGSFDIRPSRARDAEQQKQAA